MKNLAGFIYHYDSLELKLFPAGRNGDIDWGSIVFSNSAFDFYALKDSESSKKSYIEYSTDDEYNINPLRLKETIRYKCEVSNSVNPDKKEKFNLHFKNESNKLLKIERDDEKSIVFQFINYLGKSELCFILDNKPLSLVFEVVPDKIEYRTDYVNLTQAIAEECSALLLEYSSPTALSFSQDSEEQQKTSLEQFIFLRQFCYSDNIESLFASIKRNPDRILMEEDELKPFGQGLPSKRFFTNPFSYSRNWNDLGNGVFFPSEIAVTHKCESLDTPANRFLKFALNTFLEICENIITYVEEFSMCYGEASEIKNHIDNILHDSFFDDVQDLTVMPVNNHLPDSASIVKQFAYAEYIEKNASIPSDVKNNRTENSIFNAFIMPACTEQIKNIGYASADYILPEKDSYDVSCVPEKSWHKIHGILLDTKTIMEHAAKKDNELIEQLAAAIEENR